MKGLWCFIWTVELLGEHFFFWSLSCKFFRATSPLITDKWKSHIFVITIIWKLFLQNKGTCNCHVNKIRVYATTIFGSRNQFRTNFLDNQNSQQIPYFYCTELLTEDRVFGSLSHHFPSVIHLKWLTPTPFTYFILIPYLSTSNIKFHHFLVLSQIHRLVTAYHLINFGAKFPRIL